MGRTRSQPLGSSPQLIRSPTSFLHLSSILTCYSAASTASTGKLDLPGPAVVVFTVATTDVRSLTGKPRGWSHTAGCVPYFYPLRCPRWNCTARLRRLRRTYIRCGVYELLRAHTYTYVYTQSSAIAASAGWKCSYHVFEFFFRFYL